MKRQLALLCTCFVLCGHREGFFEGQQDCVMGTIVLTTRSNIKQLDQLPEEMKAEPALIEEEWIAEDGQEESVANSVIEKEDSHFRGFSQPVNQEPQDVAPTEFEFEVIPH